MDEKKFSFGLSDGFERQQSLDAYDFDGKQNIGFDYLANKVYTLLSEPDRDKNGMHRLVQDVS